MRTRFGPGEEDAFFATRDALLESYRTAVEGSGDAPDGFVAAMLLEYKWGYGDGRITDWRSSDIEDLMLGYFPRKVALDDEDLLRVAPEVVDFLTFLDHRRLLSGDPLPDLQAAARELVPEFVDAMTDPARFGMAKGLFDQMRAEGVEPTEEADVQRWLDDFNTRPVEERDAILGSLDVGPTALPPVALASSDELERAATDPPVLARLRAFAEYVGNGRKLTKQGHLTLADGKALVALLKTGDRVDERIGDRVFTTQSTAELPRLDLIFRWARAAGFVKVRRGRVSVTRRGRALGSRPLQDWGDAFDGLLKLDASRPRRAHASGLGWDQAVGWLFDHLPTALYGRPELELETLKQAVWDTIEGEYVVSPDPVIREGQQQLVGSAIDRIVDRFVEFGAVVVADGGMSLTPLGLWGTNRLLKARGAIAPVVGELVDSSATELLAASSEMPLDLAEQEIRSWIEARPDSAVRELAAAARSGAPSMMALHALTFAGPEAEAAVREMLDIAELRAQAQMWLLGNGFDDAASVSPDVLRSLMVETLAVQVDADGPVAAVAHFQGQGTETEQIRMIDDLLRAEHARTSEILELIGRYHPVKAVAKAARKTAFKRGAFSLS